MSHKLLSVLFALFVVVLAADWTFHGDDWQAKTAKAKQADIWAACTEDTDPGSFPNPVVLLEMFVESMDTTFDTVADDMPKQGPFSLFTRKKLIHSVGVIGKVEWVSKGSHPYTGLFKGAKYGFIRLSSAKKPDPIVAPGAGIKFLRTGEKSGNFMAMYSLEGQPDSWNFFKHDFTNHVPNLGEEGAPLALKLVKNAFAKASKWPTLIGLSDFARATESGDEESSPKFPYRLVLQPTKACRALFPDTETDYLVELPKTPIGPLYNVFAESAPNAQPRLIGQINLTSKFTTSKFSDESLFFQHQRMDDDLAIHPEWVAPADAIVAKEASVSHFVNPDLPYQ